MRDKRQINYEADSKEVAKRMVEAVGRSGMSITAIADKSGVSKSSISQYTHGQAVPSNMSAAKLGKVLRVNPLWLMGFNDVPKDYDDNYPNGVSFYTRKYNPETQTSEMTVHGGVSIDNPRLIKLMQRMDRYNYLYQKALMDMFETITELGEDGINRVAETLDEIKSNFKP